MSDHEEMDLFWESWVSPMKRQRKKDKKCPKRKCDITMKTDDINQKKKKKKQSKFKEAMVARKAKKKDKKKKKNRLALELDDSFIFTEACSAQAKHAVKPETSNPRRVDKLKPDHLTQDSKRKTRRKKTVAFDLSPGYISVKRPRFVSSSPRHPKESILLEHEAARDSESCSQVTVTGHSRGPTHDEGSQCTSEDINSQDLFITQKTFRASPSQPSSGEASDKAVPETPERFTQRDKPHASVAEIKQHLEGSYKCPQHSHHCHRKTGKHPKKPKAAQAILTEEEEEQAHEKHKTGTLSFETQMEINANLTEEEKVLCPVLMKPSEVNPYLAEPSGVNASLDVAKSKKHSCISSQQLMTSASTQTENFFTTELSFYLNFCQKTSVTTHFGHLNPLDLSLPDRARKDLGTCLSVKASSLPEQTKDDNHKDLNLHPPCSSGMKHVKTKPSGPHPWLVSTRGKGEATLSPQSESEPKSADTTASSEDNEPPCRPGKLDLTQVIPHDTLQLHCSTQPPNILYLFVLHTFFFFSPEFRYFCQTMFTEEKNT